MNTPAPLNAAGATVAVVRTGVANLASVCAALTRLGATPVSTLDPSVVRDASYVLLPGVGSFGGAIETLRDAGVVDALRARIERDAPTLAICLGMQLLFESSEESPGALGVAAIPGGATRYPVDARTPHMGWNLVTPERGFTAFSPGFAYFANSYRIEDPPEGWAAAWTEHAGRFVSAVQRRRTLACQFHPELSGAWGAEIIARWIADRPVVVEEEAPAC